MSRAFTVVMVLYLGLAAAIAMSIEANKKSIEPEKRGQCNDNIKPTGSCGVYKGLCSDGRYSAWMTKNCAKTCNKCPKITTTQSANCLKKQHTGCSQLKGRGFCSKSSVYYSFMTKNCAVVCGQCPGVKVTKPKPTTVTVNIKECLQAHNAYRARHGAPPLSWDSNMARQAQAYALELAKVKKMKHAPGIPHGENLAMQWGASKYTCEQATKSWYDEVKDYSYSRPGFSMATGHFTQVVWKSTKRLGVGIAKNGDHIFVVARYDPAGNVQNYFNPGSNFRQNVLPRKY